MTRACCHWIACIYFFLVFPCVSGACVPEMQNELPPCYPITSIPITDAPPKLVDEAMMGLGKDFERLEGKWTATISCPEELRTEGRVVISLQPVPYEKLNVISGVISANHGPGIDCGYNGLLIWDGTVTIDGDYVDKLKGQIGKIELFKKFPVNPIVKFSLSHDDDLQSVGMILYLDPRETQQGRFGLLTHVFKPQKQVDGIVSVKGYDCLIKDAVKL